MGRKAKKRRQSHGSAWYWKQTDCWYYTQPGSKNRAPLVDEIGALYFPGWYHGHSWSRVWNRCPVRRPLLGWYNESSPEVIDWQIKWSVENGIQYYLVDWYWNKSHRHHEHWIKGFQQAKYKSYLKWAMMWANHNGPGSHSLEDQAKATKYWIDNLVFSSSSSVLFLTLHSPAQLSSFSGGFRCGAARQLSRRNGSCHSASFVTPYPRSCGPVF